MTIEIKEFAEELVSKITEILKNIDVEDIDMFKAGYEKGRKDAIDDFYKGLLDLLDDEDRYGYLSIGDLNMFYYKFKEQGNE